LFITNINVHDPHCSQIQNQGATFTIIFKKRTILYGCAMVQAVSHHPLTTEAHVQTQASPCWICSGLSETGTGYSVYSSFCVSGTFHYSYIHSFISDAI